MRKYRGLIVVCMALATVAATALSATPARALSAGLAFSADDRSTWQANGVAYAVASSKGRVVVGGSFTEIRPPEGGSGKAIPVSSLAILDAGSGEPASCQLPVTYSGGTPVVYALNTSPDGNTVYVGGDFAAVGGVPVGRVAAIDVGSCKVTDLRVPGVSSFVFGLASAGKTLYLAGAFTTVNGKKRERFAAVDAETGALRPWVANADAEGLALAVSPDGSKVAIGGRFFAVNGAYSHSIAVVNATTGANVRTYPAGFIQSKSVTKSITSDQTGFYIGNEGTGKGVFDGRVAIDWASLKERWRDTCLGATQAVLAYQGTLYSANHAHNCGSIGYFPDGVRKHFIAQSTQNRSFRNWFPDSDDGIGEHIGPRGLAVAEASGGRRYLYAVGEFTEINGAEQQSITRFGSDDTGAPAAPLIQAEALRSGSVQVRVRTTVDDDDESLTYRIYRQGVSAPVWEGKAKSWWWSRPQITFTDKAVQPGVRYTYRVTASDGPNTSDPSDDAQATAVTKASDYPAHIIADGASLYWRFDEPSGTLTWNKGKDGTSGFNGLLARGVTLGAAGAIANNPAASYDGVDDFAWNDQLHGAPSVYTMETWIKTTTTRGGKIIGFTNSRPRTDTGAVIAASKFDRHVYMDNTGRINFGAYAGSAKVLRSPRAYNDGVWHHLVASQGPGGMTLSVDGVGVGRNTVSSAASYAGVWKVGGDRLTGWPNLPTSQYFAGQIDETAVYEGTVLSNTKIVNHYELSGRAGGFNAAPSDAYGAGVYNSEPVFYWPLNEASGPALDKSLAGRRPGTVGSAVTRRAASQVGDGRGIATAGSQSSIVASAAAAASPAFSSELWFKTTSTAGGKLLGLENSATGSSTTYDKHIYLTNAGAVVLGVYSGRVVTIRSSGKAFNDGRWHHVVGTQGSSGLRLYLDGALVASSTATTNKSFTGYWRLGGGKLTGWPSRPSSNFVKASLDEAAVYDRALSAAEVKKHYELGG